MSDLHDDYDAPSVTRAGDLSPEDEVIALAAVARRQKTPAIVVNGPRQHCGVCVRSVRLVYDGVEDYGNTVQYTGRCPACGTRHTVSERKKPQ